MSTAADTASTDSSAPMVTYATLKRGRVYFLRDREFLFDEPQEVNDADRAWLEGNAIDEVTVEDEGETQSRPKFIFTSGPAGDPAAASTSSPRSRRRS